jgi:methyl-accepting chemotaxis protein
MNALIIGGGNAAKTIIDYFSKSDNLTIEAVVDPNDNAPGMVYAGENNIATGNDMEEYIEKSSVDIVIELTGNGKVREKVLSMKQPHQEIMTAGAARILCDTLESRRKTDAENALKLSDEFSDLTRQMNGIIKNINSSIKNVSKINNSFHMTSLNATVEAARIGEMGKSFAVITDEMKKLSDNVDEVLGGIQDASEQMQTVLENITSTEDRLKAVFAENEGC